MSQHSEPNKTELRQFGLILALILCVIFGAVPFWWLNKPPLAPVLIVAALLCLWALLLPKTLRPLFRVWMAIGEVLGWINTRLILGIVFIVLFFPVSLLMRLLGKDPMRRKREADADSYRNPSHHPSREHLERPY